MKFVTCEGLGGSLCDFEAYGSSSIEVRDKMFDHLVLEHFGEFVSDEHLRSLEKKMNKILFYQD